MLTHHASGAALPIESLPVGFAEFDAAGALRRANSRFCRLLGLMSQPDSREPLRIAVATAEDAERLRRALSQAEPPAMLELGVRRADGTVLRLRLDWLDDGVVTAGRAALVTDITEAFDVGGLGAGAPSSSRGGSPMQAEAQCKLRESEQRLRALFESSPDFIWVLGNDGRYVSVNRGAAAMTGYQQAELIGRSFLDFVPEDAQAAAKEWLRRRSTARVRWFHTQLRTRHGELRHVLTSNVPYVIDGRQIGVAGITRDVTDKVLARERIAQSEAKYRSLFEHSLDGIILKSGSRVIGANPASCSILGYTEQELIAGGPGLYLDVEDPAFQAAIAERKRLGSYRRERLVRHGDGHLFPIEVLATELLAPNGCSYTWIIFRDISERKAAETELRRSRDDVRRLWVLLQSVREEEQKRLAVDLQDELGQLLTVIKLDLGWFRRRVPRDAAALDSRLADTQALVDAAVDGIHRLSRRLRPRALDDFGLIGACESLLLELERSHRVRTKLCLSHPEFELDAAVKAAIFRIIEEAISNVGRHAQASEVRVSLVRVDDRLSIHVVDDGRGFHWEAGSSFRGSGLAEIRERVRLLGGLFELDARPGWGAALSIALPLAESGLALEPEAG